MSLWLPARLYRCQAQFIPCWPVRHLFYHCSHLLGKWKMYWYSIWKVRNKETKFFSHIHYCKFRGNPLAAMDPNQVNKIICGKWVRPSLAFNPQRMTLQSHHNWQKPVTYFCEVQSIFVSSIKFAFNVVLMCHKFQIIKKHYFFFPPWDHLTQRFLNYCLPLFSPIHRRKSLNIVLGMCHCLHINSKIVLETLFCKYFLPLGDQL